MIAFSLTVVPARKTCFLICPIGDPGTAVRQHADALLERVIIPSLAPLDYDVVRADQIPVSGMVHMQIAAQLIRADLVIADLSGANPNVYYELGARHTLRRPCLQLLGPGEQLPFDVAPMRTITLDMFSIAGIAGTIQTIQAHAAALPGLPLVTPISLLVDVTTRVRDQALLDAAGTIGNESVGTSAPTVSRSAKPHARFAFEEHPDFWSSLDELDQTPETAAVINSLVDRACRDPKAAQQTSDGIRFLRSGPAIVEGRVYPPIQLAYCTATDDTICLLRVKTLDTLAHEERPDRRDN